MTLLPSYLQQQALQYRLQKAKRAAAPAQQFDNPVEWIQSQFYIPELNAPMQLHASQRIPLEEALRRVNGEFVYSTVMWSAIKKSAKSSIAAAVGMWFAWRRPGASIKVLGNDLDQAQSRVFEYMRRAVLLNPQWRSSVTLTQTKITLPNGSVIKAVPVDPAGEAGGGDDLLLYTELWGWKSKKHQQMWSESTLSPLLYGKSLRWCESYAGYEGDSPVLEQLYDVGVKQGDVLNADLEMYTNPNARLFTLWNTKPLLPWQTDAYYEQERASLTPSEFDRLHRNQWGSSTDAFIQAAQWDACAGDVPPLEPYETIVYGVDGAVSHDCFAIVGVSRRGEVCYVRYTRVWAPPKGGHIDFADVEAEVRRLQREAKAQFFFYDPYQLEDMAQRMNRAGVGWWEPFSQSTDRLEADIELHRRIVTQTLRHDGDPLLRQHVLNADAKIDPEGHRLRIVHRAPNAPMDAAVAASMAVKKAAWMNIGGATGTTLSPLTR